MFDTNILSRGYPTKLKNYGNCRALGGGGEATTIKPRNRNSKGGRGSKAKVISVGGRGGAMDIFWNYTICKCKVLVLVCVL